MKLCFGTYANVLLLCGISGIEKKKLLNGIVKSVDASCNLPSNAITPLLQCASNLPDGRSNSLGSVVSSAESASPQKVAEYFSKKIIPLLLDSGKYKLAVLAIRELIARDESISGNIVVDTVSGKTKNALLMQSKFVLSDFLAGIFLFTAQIDNRVGKAAADAVNEEFLVSFTELQDTISFVVPQKEGEMIDAASPAFVDYMASAKDKYTNAKILLYSNAPKPFYDFYVPNYALRSIGRNQNEQIRDVTAESLTAISNFIIVTGIGGLGKSMMMRHLLLNAIDSFPKLRRVPIFLPLKDYGESSGGLEEFVFSIAHTLNPAITEDDFSAALAQGLFLLLFDGLDEIDGSHSARFEREIEAFTDKHPQNYFVISSRPFQSFISFARFSMVKLLPFTKSQALELVDKSEFRLDQPEIQKKFREALDRTLYTTHRSFAQNPLLLTIMLLTFERFAEVPSKMHIFYREAFLALSVTHDANKGAFTRPLKTGLDIDEVEAYFAEICFRSYRDQKYEFTNGEFADYFSRLSKADKSKAASDFLFDVHHNLCLMYFESGKYHFVHRSFQEYFAAVFMSRQTDEFIGKLGSFFEKRWPREISNSAFPMLYDIIPERVEQFIFVPFLSDLFAKCDAGHGYWTYLTEMYPVIYYEHGDVDESACNDPQSYILELIQCQLDCDYSLSTDNLPFYDSLVDEEVEEETVTILVQDEDGTHAFEWPYYELDEGEEPPEPEIIGYKLEFDVEDVLAEAEKYNDLLAVLNDSRFKLMCEYQAARAYLKALTEKIQGRRDDLIDLL